VRYGNTSLLVPMESVSPLPKPTGVIDDKKKGRTKVSPKAVEQPSFPYKSAVEKTKKKLECQRHPGNLK
jgi:hypothetical protein